ncbi:hypothetical protein TSUD_156250 [Trifolium subterraneum]|uniref:Uncharacterized protein n=1 Tax=Trifolium subterraneum TaxID=3900 RepID=A0A2Z6M306_TRISU|nr:hypothetical protein TSUD_156250 [Trifolium subterraneum]
MKALIIKGWLKLNSSHLMDLLDRHINVLDLAYKFDFPLHRVPYDPLERQIEADEVLAVFHEMKQLFSTLNARNVSMTKTKRIANSILVEELAKKIVAKRPKVEKILKSVVRGLIDTYKFISQDPEVQNVAKDFHGKEKKKNKGGRKSCKQMECASCMRYHDDQKLRGVYMQTFKHNDHPRKMLACSFGTAREASFM